MLKIKYDPFKNSKLPYYLKNSINLVIPDILYRLSLKSKLSKISEYDAHYIQERVDYCNKLAVPFSLGKEYRTIKEFKSEKKKTYFFDLYEYLRYFNTSFKVSYLFGDITHIPDIPSLLKSRPIEGDNQNSVLMKLNKVRHFIFVNDTIAYKDKKNKAVWRGKAYRDHRQKFLEAFHNHPKCDVGQTNTQGELSVPWQKGTMSIKEQLEYKFILSIEGNDVASNLKWVMSSNSLAFMTKPKYETWFMEGRLIPNYHYVLLEDDYSNLEEKIDYYSLHIDEAQAIIDNANAYTHQFRDEEREDLISLLVLQKYFTLSGQNIDNN
jgi:hypothetical protein